MILFKLVLVIRWVKPDSLLDPWDAFFKAASRISPAKSKTPDPIKLAVITVWIRPEIAENSAFILNLAFVFVWFKWQIIREMKKS